MRGILLVNLRRYWLGLNRIKPFVRTHSYDLTNSKPSFLPAKISKMKDYKTFETERLFIRPTTEEDADFIFELLNTPKWIKHIGDRNVQSADDARNYINEKMKPQLESLGYTNNTVIRRSDGVKIGTCGLYDREGLEGVDIGFAFLPAYEKQGYAFESAARILKAAFEDFNIELVSAITIEKNTDSQNLIKKLGLKFIKMIKISGDEEELMLFQLNCPK